MKSLFQVYNSFFYLPFKQTVKTDVYYFSVGYIGYFLISYTEKIILQMF